MEHEIAILKLCAHPNICRLVDEFETPDEIYLIMELVKVSTHWVLTQYSPDTHRLLTQYSSSNHQVLGHENFQLELKNVKVSIQSVLIEGNSSSVPSLFFSYSFRTPSPRAPKKQWGTPHLGRRLILWGGGGVV